MICSSFSSLSYILKFFLLFLVRIIPNTPLTMAWPITPRAMWNLSMKHVMAMLSRVKFKLKDIPKTSFFTLSLCYLSLSFSLFLSPSCRSVLAGWARWLHSHCGLYCRSHSRFQCRGDQVWSHCACSIAGYEAHCGPQAHSDPLRTTCGSCGCPRCGCLTCALW